MKKQFIISTILILWVSIFGYVFITKHKDVSKKTVQQEVKAVSNTLPILDQVFCDAIIKRSIVENFNEDYDLGQINNNGTCQIFIGQDVSYLFSFENISKEKDHDFILNIYNRDRTLVQTIPVEYSSQLDATTINLHDDINFDGYKDMLVRVFGPRSSEFTYYIYNPTKKIFEEDNVLSNIFLPTFNVQKKEISSTADTPNYYNDKNGEQQYYTPEEQTTIFKFKNGKYTEQ